MRHAVIICNPQGDKPEVQFFARLAEAKPVFKVLVLPEGDTAELWSSTSGRIKRRRGRVEISISGTGAGDSAPAKTKTDSAPAKTARKVKE